MAAMRITKQALSPMPELLSYWLPLDDAKVLIRYLNDQIAAMISRAPERFIGLGAVPLQDVDAALRELEYCMQTLRFSGVEIASHINGVSIGDERFEAFFAGAEKMGAAIFVHALHPAGQDRIVGPFPEQAVCFPGDIGLAAASMITGGVAARHPALRIAFSHGGGVMSILLPRLVHAWNMVPKAREALSESPEVTARRFYYDQLVFDPGAVAFLVRVFGESQICLGTDYPFAMGDTHPMKTAEAAVHGEALVAMSSTNAKRFLGLPGSTAARR
jgi:aminocarboxymuconate-semialdehyde decarboxylase